MHQVNQEPAGFYMIWTKTGWAPRKSHPTFESAAAEAARLAAASPGKKYVVLHAVGKLSCAPSEPVQ